MPLTVNLIQRVELLIKKHEGFRSRPYRCPAGKLTIGYGRNLDDKGISEAEALFLLHHDVEDAYVDAFHACYKHGVEFETLPESVKVALMDMAFNLGRTKLMQFKKMFAALREKKWELAAKEAIDSKWARQVGKRAYEDAELIRRATKLEVDIKNLALRFVNE